MEPVVGLVAVFLLFGGGSIVKTWIQGKLEIDRIKAMNQANANNNSNAEVLAAIQELRKEVGELRDTTTRFDMSFDAAITGLEQRVERVEREQRQTRVTGANSPSEQPLTLRGH